MTNYKVLQSIVVGEETYHPGDVVAETDDGRDWSGMVRLKLVEPTGERQKIVEQEEPVVVESPNEDLTNNETPAIVTRKAEVKKAGVWYKVFDENGEQLGSATRDEEEAELIKLEYETQPE
jgi:hypothetical protein